MDILIRRIRRYSKGGEELAETAVNHATITLGHRNDQVLQVLDPAIGGEHLVLTAGSGGRFRFHTVGGTTVALDGKLLRKGRLGPGDSLRLGGQTLTVAEPPAGFDGALELTEVELGAAYGPATHFRISLAQTGLGTRKLAWLLALTIPALFLLIPVFGMQWPQVSQFARNQPLLPSDTQWSTGPLANAHHIPGIGADCNACHLKPFERAPDRGCVACHDRMHGHIDTRRVAVPTLSERRCASCHKEHNEPANLVRDDARLCVQCHRRPTALAAARGEQPLPQAVAGFSAAGHPEFRLTMLRPLRGGADWRRERLAPDTGEVTETSRLKFPHDLHLDPEQVTSLRSGEGLDCGICHRLRADREHFEPIDMEQHCADCHSLAFDADMPDKQLPHGSAAAAVVALEEHFMRKFADPALGAGSGGRDRRRPGRGDSAGRCEGSVLECGRRLALEEARNQFNRSGCVTCHEVDTRPGQAPEQRWRVRSVRLTDDWYPFARFDHRAHLTQAPERAPGTGACLTCHAADQAPASSAVLIPGRDNCLQCHSGERQRARVQLTCRDCHGFHLPFRAFMTAARHSDGPPR